MGESQRRGRGGFCLPATATGNHHDDDGDGYAVMYDDDNDDDDDDIDDDDDDDDDEDDDDDDDVDDHSVCKIFYRKKLNNCIWYFKILLSHSQCLQHC